MRESRELRLTLAWLCLVHLKLRLTFMSEHAGLQNCGSREIGIKHVKS